MRAFLANYQHPDVADINNMGELQLGAAFHRATLDRHLGIKTSMLTEKTIDNLRPEVLKAVAKSVDEPAFIKTHDLWRSTPSGASLFPPDAIGGAIYIVRNVLDVAPSAAAHWGLSLDQAVAKLCDHDHTLASGRHALFPMVPQLVGSWSRHVTSWLDQVEIPVCLLRYEDMARDPVTAFGRALLFAGLEYDENRLLNAIRHSRFEVLSAQEQAEGFRETPARAKEPFFRNGKVGGWREELPQDLVRKLTDVHGDTMQRLGYLSANGTPLEEET